jgi:hypothetical protein
VTAPRNPGRIRRSRQRRRELGFPPVWWAAIKVVLMVALVIGILVGLPVLVLDAAG